MFKNNFKIAIRALLKQKVYSIINIAGLAVGIASCLLIALYVQNEFSYDRFLPNADRIYKMELERKYPDHSTYYATIPHSFADAVPRDFPEVELATAMVGPFPNTVITYDDGSGELKQFEEDYLLAADSNFFSIFNYKLLKGDPLTVLKSASSMVLTEGAAKRYFGDEDPLGKVLSTPFGQFSISGICEEVPDNSHMKFEILVSAETFPFFKQENFVSFSAHTYFKLKPGTHANDLEAKFPQMVDTYAAAQIERDLGKSWEDYKKEGNGYRYFLQPIKSIHLSPLNIEATMKPGGNITSVYVMIAVAILILFIACINFTNLATARSAERAKEVGVRKTMGSFRVQLVTQFLTESFVLSTLGVLMAIAIIYVSLPVFNNITNKSLTLAFSPFNIMVLLSIAAFVGLMAGLYPSFVLSSFNPATVLKGNFSGHQKGRWIRNGLVIFQFWISIVLMIGTMVIQQQMKYMREKSMGFDKEQMLVVEGALSLTPQLLQTYIKELKRSGPIMEAANSQALPGRPLDFQGIQFQPEGSSEILTTKTMVVADDFPELIGLKLLDGKWFSKETNDSLSVVLNESAAKVMGLENPIGRKLVNVEQTQTGNISRTYTIIGVANDFNFQSLRDQITPLAILSTESSSFGGAGYVIARVKEGQVPAAIEMAEAKWQELAPEQPFKFTFLDQDLEAKYIDDQRTGKLFAIFSGLAIFVACIGLFALSAYTVSLRTKEIGVRKVLGASVGKILVLLSMDFSKMILISFILAVPVAWLVMENWWLENFAYRVQIGIGTILAAGVGAFLVAWITVSYQSIKAAVKNPVHSLKSE